MDKILNGKAPAEIKDRASNAKFDERLSLIGMMLDAVGEEVKAAMETEQILKDLTASLVEFKGMIMNPNKMPSDHMAALIAKKRDALTAGKKSGSLSRDAQYRMKELIKILEKEQGLLFGVEKGQEAFLIIKKEFDEQVKNLKKTTKAVGKRMSNMFVFCESVFSDGQEMLIIVTELTRNPHTASFISRYGCEEYFKHNKELLVYDRQKEIETELAALQLD